jgi:DNA-binding HxlR family transcriptional regulator
MVKISSLLQTPSVRILLFLLERSEVRYADLTKLMTSRGTLSLNLKELSEEGLMQRRIVTTKPIQAHYSLTEKGKQIAIHLDRIQKIV